MNALPTVSAADLAAHAQANRTASLPGKGSAMDKIDAAAKEFESISTDGEMRKKCTPSGAPKDHHGAPKSRSTLCTYGNFHLEYKTVLFYKSVLLYKPVE